MIVTAGENVYSAEVENALTGHRTSACAVIGVPDDEWGERVHAVVVPAPGSDPDPAELRDHVKGLIGGYKASRSVEFVEVLPLSGAGKVLKRELRARHWAGTLVTGSGPADPHFVTRMSHPALDAAARTSNRQCSDYLGSRGRRSHGPEPVQRDLPAAADPVRGARG
jgi:hypothetical protein